MIEQSTVSYNVDFIKKSAMALAQSQTWTYSRKPYLPLDPKLKEAKSILKESYRVLSKAAKSNQDISSAAEWLIDNFYIIQEQIVQIANDFPRDYQNSIPKLAEGRHKGLPRVYEIALNLILYTDNVVDVDTLAHYVQSFQEQEILTQGEIWAIPIMVRFVLIEQLARKARAVLERKKIRPLVSGLIDDLMKHDMREPGLVLRKLTNWVSQPSGSDRSDGEIDDRMLLVEMVRMMQSSGMLMEEEKRWFEFRFKQVDLTLDEALRQEAQEQSKLQVSIQNNISSLRTVSETDWSDFGEKCSMMDRMLRLDPAGYYPEMDFKTRDRYRKVVERLSRRSSMSEIEVSEQVLLLADSYRGNGEAGEADGSPDNRNKERHVGYYLVDEGYQSLIERIDYSRPLIEKLQSWTERQPMLYVTVVAVHTAILLAVLWLVTDAPEQSAAISVTVLLVAFFPALDLSVSAVNRLFAILLPPRLLPKLDYREGIPADVRSVIVVPTLLVSPDDARKQLEALEVRSLANPDNGLQLGLLSDFADADEKEVESDRQILDTCTAVIEELNRKYSSRYGDKFFLFHRERQWNESEMSWMGWERKRGKLEEFNRLLTEPAARTTYFHAAGNLLESLEKHPVDFVITLDADTRLPPDSAKDLVRTASHPLNRAVYNSVLNRIDRGYGIIQPKISIPPDSSRKTGFSRIFSGNVGLDPYSTVISDIYQDLNGEAIFTGKGIYDVRAFHRVMEDRLPENRILSHDLLESTYMRAGLASEIELFDDYPGTYSSYCKRNHRWTRGDWQIANWLFFRVREKGGYNNNPINNLSKWKIFDNLRRSLNPFFLLLFFITGWLWLPGSPLLWTAAAFGILAFPIYISLSSDIVNRPARMKWKLYIDKIRSNLKINSAQAFATVVILPHQAILHLDAIIRAIYRMNVTNRGILEWTTASEAESSSAESLVYYLRLTWFSPVVGAGVLAAALILTPLHWWITVPFSAVWIGAPYYVWQISQTVKARKEPYTSEDRQKMRIYARRTWFYFERLVNEEHSWLPPDNYQEDPHLNPVARTSPTNIGLSLISAKVACNLGYIPFSELLDRTEKTLNSLQMLETYRGHFYNWYETRFGEALNPKYVSTVDSGNLAAGLIVIKEAVREGIDSRGFNKFCWSGLDDTSYAVDLIFRELRDQKVLSEKIYNRIHHYSEAIRQKVRQEGLRTVSESLEKLREIKNDALELCTTDILQIRNDVGDEKLKYYLYWLESPLIHVEKFMDEFRGFSEMETLQAGQHTLDEIQEYAAEVGAQKVLSLAEKWKRQAETIIAVSEQLTADMDFSFLYNSKRGLFYIGYNTEKVQPDTSTYDLLASEARIASYIAIAKGDVPPEHWFRLSRRLTRLGKDEILLSWGGTMFEYLMPVLFMRSYPDTLLSHTYESIIRWQIEYGSKRGNPWGSSESAYNFLNLEMHYQYRAFGAPGLGLKRGLAEEYVIAPYATMLALMVDTKAAMENLEKITAHGGLGLFGFYDAIDYTPSRLQKDEPYKVVKTYMAHHHGMSLIALDNILNSWSAHNSFHSDPQIKGCDLLLQERVPRGMPIKEPHPIDVELEPGEQQKLEYVVEHSMIDELDLSPPRLHMLSNGIYSVFVSHAGTGCSRYGDKALTAWEPDTTTDPTGLFFYVRDKESGVFWSSHHQPVKRKPDRYDTWFHHGKIVTSRVDEWIETTTEVCVSSENPMELRRMILTNYSEHERHLEITSYAEIVLNRLADHNSHPAFSKLFIQTDYVEDHHAILAKRRPRSSTDQEQWLIHTVTGHDLENITEPLQFETERSRFIGRGRSLSQPAAMDSGHTLTGSIGNVSDPIASLRRSVTLGPGEKTELVFGMGRADSREDAVRLADISDNPHAADREFELASVYSMVEQEHINVTAREGHDFQKLASYMLYPHPDYRTSVKKLMQNRRHQSGLWAFGISGDLPLAVYRIGDKNQMKGLKTLLKAMSFWKLKGLDVDLLILNDHPPSYADDLQEAIHKSIEASVKGWAGESGGVFTLRSNKITDEDLTLLLTVASAVFEGRLPKSRKRSMTENTTSYYLNSDPGMYRRKKLTAGKRSVTIRADENLKFYNGYGGFSADGTEYHITISQDVSTGYPLVPPAPWINIIANDKAGFITTERGAGYTWSLNSRENKLSGWSNDPVRDPVSEALYIRDEDNREFWSPMPAPCPGDGDYRAVHGFGYSRMEHISGGLKHSVTQFMPEVDPVKITVLTLHNQTSEKRRLSLFSFLDLVMGVEKYPFARYIIPEISGSGKTMFASNHYNNEFSGRVAFHSIALPGSDADISYTTSREKFIGRNRSLEMPAALLFRETLDNIVEIGGDCCAAFQGSVELEPNGNLTMICLTGEAENRREAERLVSFYRDFARVEKSLADVSGSWKRKLTGIQVETPEESLNVMVNGWLMYQNISSRLLAKTAFYQAGGAFGFRDQLQDVMAAFYVDPELAREQILLHASRQFPEGDVQHWWHPPSGRGIRSKISDDRLWMPYVTDFYIRSVGDDSILEEVVPYITTRPLRDDEHEVYLEPEVSDESGTIYDHCCRAIDISLKMGEHGIPLIGAGDWNDGMNRVGEGGKGESVWLGFFIYDILKRFTAICRKAGDDSRAERYIEAAGNLKRNLNSHGWDGEWYLRAFYDDGTPLGSATGDECQIDAISQAWSVISGAASRERALKVLRAVERRLINQEAGIIKLLTPAFDQTEKDPGYIGGYIPGVRENGGQYTHGALWTVKAFAEAGMGNKAVKYLQMINPVIHGRSRDEIEVYKVEPYVVAADVYGELPMVGRGGWTWYTGSGAWMYRVALESVLGVEMRGSTLTIQPSVSSSWDSYSVTCRVGTRTYYKITVNNPHHLESGRLQGEIDRIDIEFPDGCASIPLEDDGKNHDVNLVIMPSEGS